METTVVQSPNCRKIVGIAKSANFSLRCRPDEDPQRLFPMPLRAFENATEVLRLQGSPWAWRTGVGIGFLEPADVVPLLTRKVIWLNILLLLPSRFRRGSS